MSLNLIKLYFVQTFESSFFEITVQLFTLPSITRKVWWHGYLDQLQRPQSTVE